MPVSELRLIKRCSQWLDKEDRKLVPKGIRGIYALHKLRPQLKKYDVVYIGMTTTGLGLKARLDRHARSTRKDWTHFSMFVVWENIRDDEIEELEGYLGKSIGKINERTNSIAKGNSRSCRRFD